MDLDKIKPADIKSSLKLEDNITNIFKSGQGAGRSGSFFFFSRDNKYIIKTMRGTEKKVLLGMLGDLVEHFKATENKSLLARIYGVYTVKSDVFESVDIIVMENTARVKSVQSPKMVFDLKGSIKNRKVGFEGEDKWWLKKPGHKKVMKDRNFVEINNDLNRSLVNFSESQICDFSEAIHYDTIFLRDRGLMDYSLLLVIEHIEEDECLG